MPGVAAETGSPASAVGSCGRLAVVVVDVVAWFTKGCVWAGFVVLPSPFDDGHAGSEAKGQQLRWGWW